jgi:hypothetical protein
MSADVCACESEYMTNIYICETFLFLQENKLHKKDGAGRAGEADNMVCGEAHNHTMNTHPKK